MSKPPRLPEDRLRGASGPDFLEKTERDLERAEQETRARNLAAPGTISTDSLLVTEDEALELFVHHMRLAHLFAQCAPDDVVAVRAEVRRLLLSRSLLREKDPVYLMTEAALDAFDAYYAALAEDD